MREREMRERIDRMLRIVAAPAGVGIAVALAGCERGAVSIYAGPMPSVAAQSDSSAAAPLAPTRELDAGEPHRPAVLSDRPRPAGPAGPSSATPANR